MQNDTKINTESFAENQKQMEALNESFTNHNIILDGLLRRQNELTKSGQVTGEYFEKVQKLIGDYNKRIAETTQNINILNNVLAAQSRAEFFGNAFEKATGKVQAFGNATKYMSNVIGEAAKGLNPIKNSLESSVKAIEPFKAGLATANTAYGNFRANMASGQSVFKAFENSSEGTQKTFEAFRGGANIMKTLKAAIAETGIGLLILAVSALADVLQHCKPVMDVINGAMASMNAMFNVLTQSIVGLFTHPIETIKNFGSSMQGAAKDAYELSLAQSKLTTALAGQEVANAKIKDQIDLLKQQTDNTKLSIKERVTALNKAHQLEETYFNQNNALAQRGMDNAIKDAKIKGSLHENELKQLRDKGTAYAQTLLETGDIDQEQFDAIKKADLELIKLRSEHNQTYQQFLSNQQKLKEEAAEKEKQQQEAQSQKEKEIRDKKEEAAKKERDERKQFEAEAKKERTDSVARMAQNTLEAYAREISDTDEHFRRLKNKYKNSKETIVQIEKERVASLKAINDKFQQQDSQKLKGYQQELNKIAIDSIEDTRQRTLAQLKLEGEEKVKEWDTQALQLVTKMNDQQEEINKLREAKKNEEARILEKAQAREFETLKTIGDLKIAYQKQQKKKEEEIENDKSDSDDKDKQDKLSKSIQNDEQNGHLVKALNAQKLLLDMQYKAAVAAATKAGKDTSTIDEEFAKKKVQIEQDLTNARIHAGDKYINAVLQNSKKDSAIYKAAFLAKKATSIADVIMSTRKAIMESLHAYSGIPFIGQALGIAQAAFMAGQGAASIAEIVKQKPGFARGGQFISDGKGALLSGYSRTDNTNAYLRSGEAVVVSEAMRNPWARNLVSAINVAYGGRDFSMPNSGRGYAIGGIFTDGGNANRYYTQPMNDQKDLANTIAYQMVNNFPPIYVDVKDINNQQNILAQTINRVNL